MHSTIVFLLVAIITTSALAAPLTSFHTPVKRSFRVEHPGRPRRSPRDAFAHAHRKFGWGSVVWNAPASENQATTNSSDAGSENGEVSATPDPTQGAYISPVTIGNQKLNLDFDTGSSDLWVFSTELPAGEGNGHTLFNPDQSSTFVSYPGASWSTQYGDGSTASGNVGFDTVDIGGATVQKQCVELASSTSGFQTFVSSDGLLGLGFSSLNQVKPQAQKTFWENIINDLNQPVFTADLDETASGSYEFGEIDSSKFTGDLHYAPVDNSLGYWMVDSKSNVIGGNTRPCQACNPAVIDTGTTLMMVDSDIADAYYSQVQGAAQDSSGLYGFPCGTALPDFGAAIGDGYIAMLKGSGLNMGGDGRVCFGGIQPMVDPRIGLQIYGDVFFKQFFVVFDGGNTQIGVGPKA